MPEYTHGDIVVRWTTRAGYHLIFRYRQDSVPYTAAIGSTFAARRAGMYQARKVGHAGQ